MPAVCKNLLSVAKLGFITILIFSLQNNLHIFITGLNVGMFFSSIFHSIFESPTSSFSFQEWVDSVVFPSGLCTFLKFWLVLRISHFVSDNSLVHGAICIASPWNGTVTNLALLRVPSSFGFGPAQPFGVDNRTLLPIKD